MVIGFITTSYRQYFKVPNGEKVDYCTFLFVLFVTKATQYCVHGGLQQIKGRWAQTLQMRNVTNTYENEASLR